MTPPKTFIDQLLFKAARRVTRHDLSKALATSLIYFLTAQFVFVLVDQNVSLGESDRLIATTIAILPPALFFLIFSLKRLSSKINFIYIAQQIEKYNPEIENRLVSHFMTRHRSSLPKQMLIEDLQKLQITSIPTPKILKKLNHTCIALLVTFVIFSIASQKPTLLSLSRLYSPLTSAPSPSKTQIFKIMPENGETIKVLNRWQVHIISKGVPPKQGFIRVFNNNIEGEKFLLANTTENIYEAQIPVIGNKCFYVIHLGDYVSEQREVSFVKNIQIKDFTVSANLPAYTSSTQLKSRPKDFALLKGSTVEFNIKFDQKVDKAEVFWQGKYHPLKINFDEAFSQVPFPLEQSTNYWLRYKSHAEKRVSYSTKHKIISIKDHTPKINLINKSEKTIFTDKDVIQLSYSAEDDIALKDIHLNYETRFSKNKKKIPLLKAVHEDTVESNFSLNLKELQLSKGDDRLVIFVDASDSNPNRLVATRSNNLVFEITSSSRKELSSSSKTNEGAENNSAGNGSSKFSAPESKEGQPSKSSGKSSSKGSSDSKALSSNNADTEAQDGLKPSVSTTQSESTESSNTSQKVDHGKGNENKRELMAAQENQQAIRQNSTNEIDLDLPKNSTSKTSSDTKVEDPETKTELKDLPFAKADGHLSQENSEKNKELSLKVFEENNDFLSEQEKILVHEFFKELRRLQKKHNSQ